MGVFHVFKIVQMTPNRAKHPLCPSENYGFLRTIEYIRYVRNFSMTGSISYRNQSIDLLCKSMDWFIYDRDFRHESKSSEI